MTDPAIRKSFEDRAARPLSPALIAAEAAVARAGDEGAVETLAAAFAYAAFFAPDVVTQTYEAFAAGWLDSGLHESAKPFRPADAPDAAFWEGFWAILDDGASGTMDATMLTGRVAALGRFLPDSFRQYSEQAARSHPRAAEPDRRETPRKLTLGELATAPDGSLGHAIHRLIVDNQFDLEVLDRESIGLAQLPPALRFLNTRILQMHDVWHLVGGFRTTGLHEIAISAFQLAQFGHGYSAMLLATVVTGTALSKRPGAPVLLQTIAEAWRHGCNTPSFMAIEWEQEWRSPIDEIRARYAISPFDGSFPPDLFEQAMQRR